MPLLVRAKDEAKATQTRARVARARRRVTRVTEAPPLLCKNLVRVLELILARKVCCRTRPKSVRETVDEGAEKAQGLILLSRAGLAAQALGVCGFCASPPPELPLRKKEVEPEKERLFTVKV